jgi:glycosyltransferase involved in cell wall biosynthesis
MVTHLPIVASRVGGISEVVEDKATGLLVEPENAESFAKALSSLLKDPEKRLQMAENGFKRVTEKFSAKVMAKKYEKLYEKSASIE